MSNLDRGIRVILFVVFAVLYFTGIIPGTLGLVLTIAGGVLFLTSLITFCPIYAIFGIKTNASKS